MSTAGPSRRTVLFGLAAFGGSGAVSLTGCTNARTVARVTPEIRLRARAATEVRALAAAYDAVIARFPQARAELSPLAAEHDAHAEALLGPPAVRRLLRRDAATRTSGTAAATGPPATAPFPVPATLPAALGRLARAERAAARRRSRQAVAAPPGTARLLASIAASEAAHATVLRGAAG